MESTILFQDGMDIDPADFNSLESFVQSSVDHIVGDAITSNNRYSQLTVSQTGTTTIGITTGRIWQGGKVYGSNNPLQMDFLQKLPQASLINVLVIGIGNAQNAAAIPREFLIDEDTGASEPRVVTIEQDRTATISYAYGVESPTPVDPIVQTAYTIIARVVLSTAGIQSVTMINGSQLGNVDDHEQRLDVLEAFEAKIGPQISTLASDIARLSNQQNQVTPTISLISQMLLRIADLEATSGIPSTAQASATDFFLDTSASDTTNPLYLAQVEEGIRYAYDGQNIIPVALFNPIDPAATTASGVLYPAYDRAARLTVGPATADVQITAYSYQTTTLVQQTMSQQRTRYGTSFTVCTNSQFWASGRYDPINGIFYRGGNAYQVTYTGGSWNGSTAHEYLRLTQFWTDTINTPYWTALQTTTTVTGAQIAETFLCGQDFWLESVGLTFTFVDTANPVTVAICQCTSAGTPDPTQVVAQATVQQPNLNISPAQTVFQWAPAYLQAGNRYAILCITSGNHKVATAAGNAFTQGNFFTLTGGGFAAGDLTKHLCFTLNSCKFRNPTTTLTLQPLSLSGGMTDIDIVAATIAPASTQLTYQVQVGGQWISLAAATAGQLTAGGNLPALLPFQVVMLGTPDIMPAIDTTKASVLVSRPKTSLVHISTPRTPPAATTKVTVIETYDNYNATDHTQNVTLLSGASYATETQPSSYSDVIDPKGGGMGIIRTYVFNLGASITSYKIKTAMTTQTALICQFAAKRQDYCL